MNIDVNRRSVNNKVLDLEANLSKLPPLIKFVMEHVFKTSFDTQLCDYRAFNFFAKGRITVIVGSSSAGKSTIIRLLKDKLNNPFIYGLDYQSTEIGLNFIHNQKNRILHSVLKNRTDNMQFLHPILWGIFDFKDEAEVEQRRLAEDYVKSIKPNILKEVYGTPLKRETLIAQKAFLASSKDRNVILEMLSPESIIQPVNFERYHMPMRFILAYCPFSLLSKRIAARNKAAMETKDYHELRKGTFALFQFAALFRPKINENEIPFDTVTRQMVEEAFESNFCPPNGLDEKKIQIEKETSKNKLLMALGFVNSNIHEVDLVPRFQGYASIINTSQSPSDYSII